MATRKDPIVGLGARLLSILLATFNFRVRGTCVLARAFHARLARFNCKTGVFSDYSLQSLQKKPITNHVFAKKISH